MGAHEYQKLEVWQRAVELAVTNYELITQLPKTEQFALADQMKRAAVSVASNIAEGQKRFGNKDTIRFNDIALGSLAELETQVITAQKVYRLPADEILKECAIISRMLHALNGSLRSKNAN
ncbi:MAG: four helix bundle protein [Candidatus Saccharibacteria bacterium]|nr:four helix bundle protein [Candidatus Saccharibacteria bacterium]